MRVRVVYLPSVTCFCYKSSPNWKIRTQGIYNWVTPNYMITPTVNCNLFHFQWKRTKNEYQRGTWNIRIRYLYMLYTTGWTYITETSAYVSASEWRDFIHCALLIVRSIVAAEFLLNNMRCPPLLPSHAYCPSQDLFYKK